MGVIETPTRLIPPGSEQNVLLKAATEEVQDKGFVVAKLDNTTCIFAGILTGATGLEPATSGVTGRRSNQLSYAR